MGLLNAPQRLPCSICCGHVGISSLLGNTENDKATNKRKANCEAIYTTRCYRVVTEG